jgi:hypothetical protein
MNHRAALLVLFMLAFALGACSQGGETASSPGASPSSLLGEDFAVVDAEDAYANIEDATLDQEMAMSPVFTDPERFRRHHRHPGLAGCHLGLVLMQLGLDDDQRMAVRAAVMMHRRQIRAILEQLRAANASLIEAANVRRAEIIAAYRAGDITREEAARQLYELSVRTREAIRNNPDNEPFLQALCDSRIALFEEIRSILNDEQRETWDAWLAGLPGSCLGANTTAVTEHQHAADGRGELPQFHRSGVGAPLAGGDGDSRRLGLLRA